MPTQTARNAIQELEVQDILTETTGKDRYQEFGAVGIFDILDQPADFTQPVCEILPGYVLEMGYEGTLDLGRLHFTAVFVGLEKAREAVAILG